MNARLARLHAAVLVLTDPDRLRDERGQATTEYALVLLAAALVALLVVGWATAGGAMPPSSTWSARAASSSARAPRSASVVSRVRQPTASSSGNRDRLLSTCCRARTEPTSVQCRSSRTTATGPSWATAARTASIASNSANRAVS